MQHVAEMTLLTMYVRARVLTDQHGETGVTTGERTRTTITILLIILFYKKNKNLRYNFFIKEIINTPPPQSAGYYTIDKCVHAKNSET